MTHSELSYVQPPPISPLRHALNVLTNRGQLPPELQQIVLEGSALDTEEDESPSTPRLSPLPSPHFAPRRSQSQSTGTRSNGVSPRLGLVSFGRRAVSLARRASASASGGVRKWQLGEKERRSFSVTTTAIPLTSREETARQPSLLFSPPDDDDPPAPNDPFTGITTDSLSSPSESIIPLSALDVPLASFPAPSPLMSSPSLSPISDDDNNDVAQGIPVAHSASMADVTVPAVLRMGTPMIKVSGGKHKKVVFRLDPDQGQIIWESKKHRISTSLILTRRRLSQSPLLVHSTHREY
jgi:hypothetical protein